MDAINAQIRTLAQSTDDAGRLDIEIALRKIRMEIQTPQDTLMELANSNLLIAMFRLGVDLGVFRELSKANDALTVSQLADTSQASFAFMERILRYYASTGVIAEVSFNSYRANISTHVLADPRAEGMAHHGFDIFGPIIQSMPDFFMDKNYEEPASNVDTPFQRAFNTNLSCFDWLVQQPKHFASLQKIMTSLESAEWTNGFELIDTEAKRLGLSNLRSSERPFLVDVGGGHGHQCVQLGKKYPHLLGRLVLQDLPEAIDRLPPIDGVRAEAHDFFQKQDIVDAKFYYLRRIMHDWPDKEAQAILSNISSVMSSDARILIDEVVLPDTGAHWQATMADLSMMFAFGGKERTTQQWNSLVKLSGLRIEQVHTYVASTYTSILVLARE
ncbi:hypothetical protein N7456_010109 [Penicillium angulare]|uniref:O-methyltransferase domain-containing protein n=1 Tax=Penicillium angulare TaxID=116970 RepID=A0A9W9F600_9EURO|nr:hypothetical protein N7456_010109 [Penicillium angulare]